MNRKSQNFGQVFIYILSIVVVGLILLYSYNAITNLLDRQRQMVVAEFQNNLRSSIQNTVSQYGTMRKMDFELSESYSHVCFVRNYDISGVSSPDLSVFADYPIIKESFEDKIEKNVFLIKPLKEVAESFRIENIRFKEDTSVFECYDLTGSTLTLRIEGRGDHVIISK